MDRDGTKGITFLRLNVMLFKQIYHSKTKMSIIPEMFR